MSEGARRADIGRKTLYRWMEDEDFRAAFQQLRRQAADLARTELEGLMLKGAVVLAEAMDDENPHVRLRAANSTLSLELRFIDLKELRQRIEQIHDAFHLWARRRPPI